MTIANTGERLIPDAESEPWNVQIHMERYGFARRFVRDSARVLDYGCGVGYGLHSLVDLTQGECLGVDKDDAIAFARTRYVHPRLSFAAADLTADDARFGAFDVILSFDVIEHVADMGAYLDNIAHQLRDAHSVAIISTPWSPRPDNIRPLHNPFHEVELTFTEFTAALSARFCIAELTLTLGMVAVLRRRDAGCEAPNVIALTTDHVRGMEAIIDAASVANESLIPLAEAAADLAWIAKRRSLVRSALERARSRLLPRPAPVLVETCTIYDHGLGGIAFALDCKMASGVLDVSVRHRGEVIAEESLPLSMLSGRRGHRMAFAPLAAMPGEVVEARFEAHGVDLRSLGLIEQATGGPRCQLLYRRYHWRGAPGFVQDVVWMREVGGQLVAFDRPLPKEPEQPPAASNPKARMLPPLEERPWPRDAGIATKTWRSLRAYGLAATLREIGSYLRQ